MRAAEGQNLRQSGGKPPESQARFLSGLQVLVEEGQTALPGVLRGLLLVDLRAVVREEAVGCARVEDELDVGIGLLQLGLEALHVLARDPGVRLAPPAARRGAWLR